MQRVFYSFILISAIIIAEFFYGCDYVTHRTLSQETVTTDEEPDPDYKISLDYNYQDFTSFMYMGNRAESFGTYFNKFFTANEDFQEAFKEYKSTQLATYNQRLDSVNIITPVLQSTKDKFTKVIERCSKIIQYNKNTKYLDDAVMLIGLSYFYSNDFLQAERKFNEFLSKLSTSDIADEALLYLGITKLRLKKTASGETILKSLLQTSKNDDIKSQALTVLAIHNLGLKNISVAIEDLKQSIEITKDKEIKAERQFLLAKVYSIHDKKNAPEMYAQAFKNTSNFDFEFYAKLNEAKAYNEISEYRKASEILEKMDKKYLDYPDFKQLVELEIANTDLYEKKYDAAKLKYFYIIVKYPGTKAAAESYYRLGTYYESVKSNYLNALVSYKKANETNMNFDYASISSKKAVVFDKYFTVIAIIKDTTKIEVPAEEKELQEFKIKYDEEQNKEQNKQNVDPKSGIGNPKGGGFAGRDSIPDDDSLLKEFEKIIEKKNEGKQDTVFNPETIPVDTSVSEKGNEEQVKTVNTDSLNAVKDAAKINAYFELAEIFYYDLNHADSSIYYLDKIIADFDNTELESKASFYLGTIYKSMGDTAKAYENFNYVIKEYPNSIYANESRINLGINVIKQEAAKNDSLSAIIDNIIADRGDRNSNIQGLYTAIGKDTNNADLPKAYYTLGWAYENYFSNKDSVLKYYGILVTKFPSNELSVSIKPKYDFYTSLDKKDTSKVSKENVKDSVTAVDSLKIDDESLKDSLNTIPEKMEEKKQEEIEKNVKEEQKKEEEKINEEQKNENPEEKLKENRGNSGPRPEWVSSFIVDSPYSMCGIKKVINLRKQ